MCPFSIAQELISKVSEVLKESPPLKPSNAAVDLLLAVGRLQACYLDIHVRGLLHILVVFISYCLMNMGLSNGALNSTCTATSQPLQKMDGHDA